MSTPTTLESSTLLARRSTMICEDGSCGCGCDDDGFVRGFRSVAVILPSALEAEPVTLAVEAATEQTTGGCCDPVCGPTTCGTAAEAPVELLS